MIFELEKKDPAQMALLSDEGISVSYGELCEQIAALGAAFGGRSLLFCMCENSPGAVLGYLAALETDVVPLMLDAHLKREQFDHFFETYRPKWLWLPEAARDTFSDLLDEAVYQAYGYALYPAKGAKEHFLNEKLSLLLATSGSTGTPKLVRLSKENLTANTVSIASYLKLDDKERPITTLPLQYTYGLSIVNSHLFCGACVLMTKVSYVQKAFWDFFEKEHATSFGGVPYTYQLLKRIHIFDRPLPGLHAITQAGGKLSPELQIQVAQWAAEQGIDFYVMYGQTEATARMSYLPPEMCLKKPGSIGIAIPGGSFTLEDDTGKRIETIETAGELIYHGPNVSLGYAECAADLALGDERGGVLRTGDLAKRDISGYYYIVGRKKRFIKLFGVRISLDACEQILSNRYPSSEVVCAGADDHLKIYLTSKEDADTAADYLADYLQLSRKGFKAYDIPEIPRSDAGKILYKELPFLEE